MPMLENAPTELLAGDLIQCVTQSVSETFANMCGGETTEAGNAPGEAPADRICGIISFSGDAACSFMLGLPRQTAVNLTLAFIGAELEFEGADMNDAVGELTNIVAGDIVARLEGQGIEVAMSLPTVVRGDDVELLLPYNSVGKSFESPTGGFWIKVAVSRSERSGGGRDGWAARGG